MALQDTKVFISHASENKEAVAREVADLLAKSTTVWFDDYSIEPGGSIFDSINEGLAKCDFGVVILSKDFFRKKWTRAELAGLFGREDFGTKIIPIWHDVSYAEVSNFSPIMADRRAIKTSEGVQAIAEFVLRGIRSADVNDSFIHTGTIDSLFGTLGKMITTATEKETLYRSEHGAEKVYRSQSEFFAAADTRVTEIALASPQLNLSWAGNQFRCIPNDKIYFNINAPSNLMLRFEGTRPSRISIDIARIEVLILKLVYDDFGVNKSAEALERYTFIPEFNDGLAVMWKEGGTKPKSNLELIDFGLSRLHEHITTWAQQRYRD